MNSRDEKYLQHIYQCILDVESYGLNGAEDLEEDAKDRNATLHSLQLLAQSAARLSDETAARLDGIEIEKVRGFRNIIVHQYLEGVDYEVVWQVVERRLPELKSAILKIYVPKVKA